MSQSPPAARYDDSSSDEEYSFKGVRLRTKRGEMDSYGPNGNNAGNLNAVLGKRAPVQPIPAVSAGVPALLLHPEDRLEGFEDENRTRNASGAGAALANAPDGTLEIKPLVLHNDPEKRRQRSMEAVTKANQIMYREYGVKPRLVEDTQTGYLLPRDMVVDIRPPKVKMDDRGNMTLVANRGEDLSPEALEAGEALGDDEGSGGGRYHYQRSIQIVRQLRQQQLLQELEEEAIDEGQNDFLYQ